MTKSGKRYLCLATLAALTTACGNPSVDTSQDVGPSGADVGGVDAGRDAGPGDTGPTCPSDRVCGAECCGPSQTCENGKCVGCDETEEEMCGRLGKDCGPLAADDVCGKARTVASCGVCKDGTSCDAAGKCVPCKQETDKEFCDRLKKNCGPFSGDDNCGKQRAANCGSCPSGTCDLATNTCKCTRQTREEFCAAKGIQCGVANGKDNCDNSDRTETCGPCAAGDICNAQQRCELCLPVTPEVFCQYLGKACGEASGTDACGDFRTVPNCGSCTAPETCNASGHCSVPGAPDNDTCSDPEEIILDASGHAVVPGDTTYASNDATSNACRSWGGSPGADMVYKLDTTGLGTKNLVVNFNFSNSDNWGYLYLRSACDVPTSELACAYTASNPLELSKANLAPGVYYLWVDTWDLSKRGTFTLTVSLSAPPPADDCTAPGQLVFDPTTGVMTPVAGNTTGANNDGDGTCVISTGKDLVYQFALNSQKTVEITATPDSGSGLKPNLYLRTACSDKTSEVGCMAAGSAGSAGTLTVYGLDQGIYYLWVDGASSAANGPFTLTGLLSNPPSPPGNDACARAEALTFDPTGKATRSGTTVGAIDDYSGSCLGPTAPRAGGDVVYSFTIGGTDNQRVIAKVTRDSSASGFEPAVYIRSGNCASALPADEKACAKQSSGVATATAASLPPGDYYVIVDTLTGSVGAFTLEVTVTALMPDTCASAQLVTFDPTGKAVINDDTTPAAADAASLNCSHNSNGRDLVYKIDTTRLGAKSLKATMVFTAAGNNNYPLLYLRTVCDTTVKAEEIACAYNGSKAPVTLLKPYLPAGVYYLWADSGYSGDNGPFNLEITLGDSVPDNCAAPGALTFVGDVARATGDTGLGLDDGDGSCTSATGADLVYKFEIPREQSVELEVTPDAGSGLRPSVYLRSTCDQGASQLFCLTASAAGGQVKYTVPRLAQGAYYLWVDSYSASTTGAFSLKVTKSDPDSAPPNDTCARPQSLTVDPLTKKATVTGASTTLATNDYAGRCATLTAPHNGPDLVYSVELTAPGSLTAKVTRAASTPAFRPAVYIRKTLCESNAVEDQAACANESNGLATATQLNASVGTYYVIVDGIASTFGEFDLEVSLSSAVDLPDNCFAAKFVDVSSGSATVSGDASQALNDGDGACVSGTGKDLVYRFTTTDWQDVDITVTPSTGSALRPNIYVRSSCDDKTREVGCVSAGSATASTLSLVRLPAGTWFVWVDSWSLTTVGPFTMNILVNPATPPAPNPVCRSAEALQFTGDKATHTGDTRLASNDYAGTCNAAMPGGDVVYSFNIPSGANKRIFAKVSRGASASTSFEPAVYIRSVCDSALPADEKACAKHSSGVATATIANLPAGDYYVIVDSLTATGGPFTLEVTLAPLYPDDCSRSQLLTFDRNGRAFITDDTTNAAADAASLNCSHNSNGHDLVYKIDTTPFGTKNLTATMVFNPAGNRYPLLYLRTVCDTTVSAEEIACAYKTNSDPVILTKQGLAGGVYYLWADSGYSGDYGPFELEVRLSDPIPNDTCSAPVTLTFGGNQATDFGFTTGGGNDYTGTCATMDGPDVVYAFSVPGPGPMSVTATVARDPAFPAYQPAVYIRSNCASALAADEKACGSNVNGTAFAKALSLAQGDYYLIVDGVGSSGAFDLHVSLGPPEVFPDTCASPALVELDRTGYALILGDTTRAAADARSLNCTHNSNGRDLVYKLDTSAFGTKNLTATMVFNPQGNRYPLLYLRTVCDTTVAAEEIACAYNASKDPVTLGKANLAPGVYYLWADSGYSGDYGTFELEVQLSDPPQPPTNTSCATAEPLTLDSTGKAKVFSTTTGTTDDFTGVGSCGSMTGPDTVYKLELPQDASVKVTVTRDAFSSNFSPSVYMRSTCTSGAWADQVGCATHSSGVATLNILFLPRGTYYLVVDGATATSGGYKLEVVTGPPGTRGDACVDPIALNFNAAGAAQVSGDTSQALNSGDGTCNSSSGSDLVYSMTLSREKTVQIAVTPSSAHYPNVYVRTACDDKAAEVGCVSKSSSVAANLFFARLQPATYYIWVDGYSSTKNGTFDMTVTTSDPQPIPVNDQCSGAVDLNVPAIGTVSVSGETTWASHQAAGRCDQDATAPEVFYKFTLAADASVVAKVTRSASSPDYNPSVYIRRDCGISLGDAAACAVQSSGVATVGLGRLSAGTYYVVVDGQTTTFGGFTLDLTTAAPVAGDTCADAAPLPAFDPTTGIAQVTSDLTAAGSDSAGSCSSAGSDLVYWFWLPTPKKVDVAVTPSTGSGLKPAVYLRSLCDQTATELTCAYTSTAGNTATLSYATLGAGTYYVWVDSYDLAARGPFTLKVTAVDATTAPPGNDACQGATDLVFSGTPAKATKSGVDASYAVNDTSGTCAVANGPDVVYRFQTSAPQKVTAKVTRVTSTLEPVVYIRAACEREEASNELTCAKHSSGTATAVVNNLPVGTWYVIVDSAKATKGTFNLEVTLDAPVLTSPVNESCYAAMPLTLSGGNAQAQGTTTGAQNEAAGTCTTSTGTAPDVVYSVYVGQAGDRLKATLTPASGYAPALYVRRSCGDLLPSGELACTFRDTVGKTVTAVARDLAAGTYFLWVDGGTSSGNGGFTLDVNVAPPSPPGNDTCSRPETLTRGVQVTGDTTEATQSFDPFLYGGTCTKSWKVGGPEVVYRYTPATDGPFTVSVTSVFDAVVWYAKDVCGMEACGGYVDGPGADATETLTVDGVARATYYIVVDGFNPWDLGTFTIKVE